MTGLTATMQCMLPRTYSEQTCTIARALEVVGERWTLLILRDAFLGVRRFDDFQARLEISRTVLTRRLSDLVEVGLLRREPYQQRPVRYDYLLTERALELWPALVGLAQWGTSPGGAPREFVHDACGTVIQAVTRCPHCEVDVPPEQTATRPGPGHRSNAALPDELRAALEHPRPLLADVRR
jgi:DNA-binding HxlR family transcriptional regulator